jgi:hypothetical protein
MGLLPAAKSWRYASITGLTALPGAKPVPKGQLSVVILRPQASLARSFRFTLVDSHPSGSEAGIEGAVAVSERLGRQHQLLIRQMSYSAASICYPHPWPLAPTPWLAPPKKRADASSVLTSRLPGRRSW